jgi:hypothetical protein
MPMQLNFDVSRVVESMFVGTNGEKFSKYRDLSLVLRADHYAKICLTSGENINNFDIDFMISTKWNTGQELDGDLKEDEIGFLCHTKEGGSPYIHGGAIWLLDSFPEGLGSPGMLSTISLTLSNVETIADYAPSFEWGLNRPNILRISSIKLSVVRSLTKQINE